ncbi:uncharacterized protein BDR25DRAFT_387534 [Lindgomyces ingoldianus]|uniref:Uncharacterized protein n=1 Tax=Lindgomyces ingoldianus TaxID=673940 RepID=A0ACB6R3I9_9PLEO|nr:uncharacterized protein BDR25DRAFT_387534 [Lindgomyces ingoldianus]KAF2473350.1 hypothetical protein BDR25DRAFT_387534 [Lindgomyces ingoldianus]
MGIRGLAISLEPYAARYKIEELDGHTAIIDGPSLAYHAYHLAGKKCPLGIPSYRHINQEAIRWLRSLQENFSIKISHIFFDGALPVSKKEERLLRLKKGLEQMSTFRAINNRAGCPIPQKLGSVNYPFLAPSLLEALRGSEFDNITRTVPGEADDWCAHCASLGTGRIIFTSDTDLICFEYTHEVLIAFFRGVTLEGDPSIHAYPTADIRNRLKLKSLVPLAYAMIHNPYATFAESLLTARTCNIEFTEYLDFKARYANNDPNLPYVLWSREVDRVVRTLDARIAEFVHQMLPSFIAGTTLPDLPEIFLPPLFEDPNEASAWSHGRNNRILAYSLFALNQKSSLVCETTRRGHSMKSIQYEFYPRGKIIDELRDTTSYLQAWLERYKDRLAIEQSWRLLAVRFVQNDLQTLYRPVYNASAFTHIVHSQFDSTWKYVQLSACVQAVLYSFRTLHQCISVYLGASNDLEVCGVLQELNNLLSSLPLLADFPSVGAKPRSSWNHARTRSCLRDIYADLGIKEQEHPQSKKKRAKGKQASKGKEGELLKRDPNNSFVLLRQDEDT